MVQRGRSPFGVTSGRPGQAAVDCRELEEGVRPDEALWLELTESRGMDFRVKGTLEERLLQLARVLMPMRPVGVFVPWKLLFRLRPRTLLLGELPGVST
jgi:hypothetical protein